CCRVSSLPLPRGVFSFRCSVFGQKPSADREATPAVSDRTRKTEHGKLNTIYRWHVEQLVSVTASRTWFFSFSSRPSSSCVYGRPVFGFVPAMLACHLMLNTWSCGRRCRSGERWHAMHHSIKSVLCCIVRFIWSMRPWQETHPMP